MSPVVGCVTHLNTQLSRLVCKQHILLLVHVMHTLPVMHTLLAPGHAYVAGSRSLRHRFVVHIACTHKTITSSQRDTQRIGQSERAADDLRDQSIDRGSTLQWPYIHRTAPSILFPPPSRCWISQNGRTPSLTCTSKSSPINECN